MSATTFFGPYNSSDYSTWEAALTSGSSATTLNYYGPYDITDYTTYETALDAGVSTGSRLSKVNIGYKVVFIEYAGIAELQPVQYGENVIFMEISNS